MFVQWNICYQGLTLCFVSKDFKVIVLPHLSFRSLPLRWDGEGEIKVDYFSEKATCKLDSFLFFTCSVHNRCFIFSTVDA